MWKYCIYLLLLLFGMGFCGSAFAATLKSENLENCSAISRAYLAAIYPGIFQWHLDSGTRGVGGGAANQANILCFSVNEKAHLSLAHMSLAVKAYHPPRYRRLAGAHMVCHLPDIHRIGLQGSVLVHDISRVPYAHRRSWHSPRQHESDSAQRSPRRCHIRRTCPDPQSRGSPCSIASVIRCTSLYQHRHGCAIV